MSLKLYRKKRDFKKTAEPKGDGRRRGASDLAFVVQKHDASRLHYDFRLEWDGTLKSWAVPKGPSLDPARKVLAVQVEDHPIEYGDFEGVIPKGQYGGGTVLLWDRGTWEPLHDPAEGLARGKLHFILHGQKLKGEWSLVRMGGRSWDDGKNWLLMKLKDEYASKTRDILADSPQSAKSKPKLPGRAQKTLRSKRASSVDGKLPTSLAPRLAVLAGHPPQGDQWLHEIKFDGYRLLAFIEGGNVKLLTRNGLDWTGKFPDIAQSLAKLKVESAIVDGEVVVLDKSGRSDFQSLQGLLKDKAGAPPVYYAFDLLFSDGVDLRNRPLLERKQTLKDILERSRPGPRINFSEHIRGDGQKVFQKACGMGLEGIISKRIDAPYVSGRVPTWLKSKCDNRQEFVIIGYTNPQGHRSGFGALLLGYHDERGRLVYAGRVGTGFDQPQLDDLHAQLQQIEQDEPPTDLAPPARERRATHWVTPKLVAEVRFSGWTRDGVLRHPAFIALRTDKPASQIVREKPVQPEKLETSSRAGGNGRNMPTSPGKSASQNGTGSDGAPIAGVRLTHPDKLLYPDERITKRDLAEYYQSVQQWMIPHVIDRPLALVRCPDGLSSQCFFQRNWSQTLPAAIDKADVGEGKKVERHVAIHGLDGLISLVQIGVLELHTWGCRIKDVERPDQLIFDLDPGPDVPWKRVIEAAWILHKTLDSLKLPAFLKTSGGKGLHLTIPVKPAIDWDSAKTFCQTLSRGLAQQSDLFVSNMRKDLRGGKVYIDYNRNGRGATAVAPYSTRARPGAPISMPISWDELGRLKSADAFTLKTAPRYLAKRKADPWRDFERSRVDLRQVLQSKPAS